MISSLNNDYLEVSVKHFGSTLTSVKSAKSGYEFLWQGNPEIWKGQSPILFPIIGRLLDDCYTLNNKTYQLIKHGLARHNEFDMFSQTDNELTLVQLDNQETFDVFPFHYKLYVSFRLDEDKLTVKHTVKNNNEENMYFSIGAHPAFNCKMGDKLVFEKPENASTFRIDENAILTDKKELILDNSDTLVIEPDIFNKDALIFSGLNSSYVTLEKQAENKSIVFNFGDAPYFGVWAKPGAPFVCLEPWYGINDSYEKKDDISQKEGIICLEPHTKFSFSWEAQFKE